MPEPRACTMMGSVLISSLLLLFGNLLADLLLVVVDPRIDFQRLEDS